MDEQHWDANELQEIIGDFVTESGELIETAIQDIVNIEGNADGEILNGIFRAVHTIKGTASFLGFSVLSTLAHRTEDVLGKMRKGELAPNNAIIDVLLHACDLIKAIIEEIGAGGKELSDTGELLKRLEAIGLPQPVEVEKVDKNSDEQPPKKKIEEILVEEEVLTRDELAAVLEKQKEQKDKKLGEILLEEKVVTEEQLKGVLAKQSTQKEEQTVRVDVRKLDELMNLVGELVLGKNRLMLVNSMVRGASGEDEGIFDNLTDVTNYVETITNDLQGAVMRARLVPVSKVFNKIPRLVRDLSAESGKQVELKMEGEETELDKSLIETLHDPLIHIIRNSVDHGIELPDVRSAQGKQPKGSLVLKAYGEGNQVVIEIFDDGKGINVKAVKQKVKEKGLMPDADVDALSKQEAMNLIFIPGLSTAEKLTSVSGRGVGMDVVRTNIEKMNGQVYIDSEEGKWTKLTLKLPLTLAIMKALIVQSREELFAIPLNTVVELVKAHDGLIKSVDKSEVVVLRDRIIPLVSLSGIVSPNGHVEDENSIIVCHLLDKVIGLKVNSVIGQEEVVIKPLGEFLRQIRWVGGATIRGDGKVVLILDLAAVVVGFARQRNAA